MGHTVSADQIQQLCRIGLPGVRRQYEGAPGGQSPENPSDGTVEGRRGEQQEPVHRAVRREASVSGVGQAPVFDADAFGVSGAAACVDEVGGLVGVGAGLGWVLVWGG